MLLLAAVTPFVLTDFQLAILVSIMLGVIGAVATNLLIGVANQASIGNAALMAIGAFSAARVAAWLHLPMPLTVLVAGFIASRSTEMADQPRVRERIMKLSKVYSATCHHKYWSER